MSSAVMVTEGSAPRRDIEGLRAIAVLSVVAVHVLGGPVGGFVGVDVFFVISGFLITGLLVREARATGTISFREFYARRVRRIMPAALLTLAVICIIAHAVFYGSRAEETYTDALWAAFSLANWRMASTGTDYFQSTLPPSVIQHFWSLSVEEQFYLAWPLLIATLTLIAARAFKARTTPVLAVGLGLICVASFGWSLYQSVASPTVAYFSTFTRAWELGAGGLLALLVPAMKKLHASIGVILTLVGLAVIAVALWTTTPEMAFPGPWAAPAVLGTALVIAGGSVAAAPQNPLLANPVARFVGNISYSLYLWHWPAYIFGIALFPEESVLRQAGIIAVAMVVSTITFYTVEQPIRRTNWLSSPKRGPRRGLSPQASRGYIGALGVGGIAATLFLIAPQPAVTNAQEIAVPEITATASGTGTGTSTANSTWTAKIEAAVGATEWPTLRPSLDNLLNARAKQWKQCGNVDAGNMGECHFGSSATTAKNTVVVIGDSIGISWLPAVDAALSNSGWSVQGLTWGECPAPRIDVESGSGDKAFTTTCANHQSFAIAKTKQLKPDVVIVANSVGTIPRIKGAADDTEALAKWQSAEESLLKSFPDSKVLLLSPPPPGKDLTSCATKLSQPANCLALVGADWTAMSSVDEAAAQASGATYVSTKSWFCDSQDRCPGFIGTTPVMADGVHLCDAMARLVAPQMEAAVSELTAKKR